ncbi:hypothetical protein [Anabaena sp. UHCC 0253]|nr:hypothetical protein [Anabaena sp. UHCC 0253]
MTPSLCDAETELSEQFRVGILTYSILNLGLSPVWEISNPQ